MSGQPRGSDDATLPLLKPSYESRSHSETSVGEKGSRRSWELESVSLQEEQAPYCGDCSKQRSSKKSRRWLRCTAVVILLVSGMLIAVLVGIFIEQSDIAPSIRFQSSESLQLDSISSAKTKSPFTGRTYSEDFLAFARDVVLTVKTGGAVFFQRLPIHLLDEESSLRLINKTMFFADFEADIAGLHVYDALGNMSMAVHQQNEFEPYFTLQNRINNGEPMTGSPEGWSLDKYKFLPLHGMAYRAHPSAKFSIHIEADTYLIQDGMLRWLYTLNPDEQILAGAVALINDKGFAHGGSGYVLSQGLLDATWGQDPYLETRYDQMVENECCGDYVLSEVFRGLEQKGVHADGPNIDCGHRFQGSPPMEIDFHRDNICDPIFTFHHVSAEVSHALFDFEKTMYAKMHPEDFVRYMDVYDHFMPSFLRERRTGMTTRLDWDNMASDRLVEVALDDPNYTMDAFKCAQKCNEWKECLMWRLSHMEEGLLGLPVCRLADRVVFGKSAERIQSGWMTTRIHNWIKSKDCYERFNRGAPMLEGGNTTSGVYAE